MSGNKLLFKMYSKNKSTDRSLNTNQSASKYFSRFYLSQGYAKNNTSTNDCGPACAAMILNVLKETAGSKTRKISIQDVTSRIPPFGRLPGWIPSVGGASAPWGLTVAFNRLAREHQLPWKAKRIKHANLKQLQKILRGGGYATFLRFWKIGGAHWTNIMAMMADQRQFILLDPNPFLSRRGLSERVQVVDFSMIQSDWRRQPWWAACLGIKNEVIWYSKTETDSHWRIP